MRESWVPVEHVEEGRKGRSRLYDLARFIGSPFNYDVAGMENIQTAGPAIFVANHLGALGPIEIILSVPIRFYPWTVADMIDYQRAPEYLNKDFVRPMLHLRGRLGFVFSTLLTKISVPLLRSVNTISIEQSGSLSPEGFRQSLHHLKEGKNLLIFPEDDLQPLNPTTLMCPFLSGFAVLCSLFQQGTNTLLPVYPIAVHAHAELVTIGKAEFYGSSSHRREDINDFCQLLEKRVTDIYLEMQKKTDDILNE